MKKIPLNNKDMIAKLEKFFWLRDNKESVKLTCSDAEAEKYVSDEYLQTILDMGKEHNGFPEVCKSWSFHYKTGNSSFDSNDPQKAVEWRNKFDEISHPMQSDYNLRTNALCVLYPPGGFISWHNNANASAFNIIFTWSETGDGWFKYRDGNTGEIITIHDTPGWQVKMGYFGSYHEQKENLCYHAAYTDCYRMTVSYVLDRSETSKQLQEWLIEDISAEED